MFIQYILSSLGCPSIPLILPTLKTVISDSEDDGLGELNQLVSPVYIAASEELSNWMRWNQVQNNIHDTKARSADEY